MAGFWVEMIDQPLDEMPVGTACHIVTGADPIIKWRMRF
jgi:hypothetical protein